MLSNLIREIQLANPPTAVGVGIEEQSELHDPLSEDDLLIELEGDIGDNGSDKGTAGGDSGNLPNNSFTTGLLQSDGTINLGLLGDRAISTVAYGLILSIIGYIQFIGDGIESWTSGLSGFIQSYIGAVYTGGSSSSGVVGAIDQVSTQTAGWIDALGVAAYPITILIGMALGIAVIRVTLAGIEIILGTNL